MQQTATFEELLNTPIAHMSAEMKARRRASCGRPYYFVSALSGGFEQRRFYCKQYRFCEDCADRKRRMEMDRITNHSNWPKSEQVIIPHHREEDLKRELPDRNHYLRIPTEENLIFVVAGVDGLEELAESLGGTYKDIPDTRGIRERLIVPEGTRMSGSLFAKKNHIAKEIEPEPTTIEELIAVRPTYKVKVERQGFLIDFDTATPDAPQNIVAFWEMVQDEVQIDSYPWEQDQLQYTIYCLQSVAQNIADRYNLTFNFYDTELIVIDAQKMNWRWLKIKLGMIEEEPETS